MNAIVLDAYGEVDLFYQKEMPLPRPGRSEVRVKLKATGFNPLDCKMRRGVFQGKAFPLILGIDFSGIVDTLGDLVKDFSLGEEVFGMAYFQSSNGSYAQYVCVPAAFLAKKPKNLSFEEAAVVPISYLTAFQALIGKGAMQKNRAFFLSGGSGGVGSAALSLARVYELGPAFTTAGSDMSATYLMENFSISSDRILRYKGLTLKEMVQKALEMNKGERFYLTLDFVGGISKDLCLKIIEFFGHFVTILPEQKNHPIPVWGREENLFWKKSLSLHMVFVLAAALYSDKKYWSVYKAQLAHLSYLFEKEGLQTPKIENLGSFSVETIQKAHKKLEEGHGQGKLVMSHSNK